ncbi:MAG: leucine-rich repeat domain-containing protein [Clostridia bacterium]|nr:leucine-rich repeat domain-containing protein [Clostridia bacterium]
MKFTEALKKVTGAVQDNYHKKIYGYSGDELLIIPEGTTYVDDGGYSGNTIIKCAVIPEGVTDIGVEAFFDSFSLTKVYLPSTLKSIYFGAFSYTGITGIDIPEGVADIGSEAFFGCSSLVSINIPDSITYIGYEALNDCTKLKYVTFGANLSTIGEYQFYDSHALELIDCTRCKEVPTLGSFAFNSGYGLPLIKVPYNLYDEWISSTNWSAYADYITCELPSGVINERISAAKQEAVGAATEYSNSAFSGVLKGRAVGEALMIEDVSPAEHEMKVRVSGKNLFPAGAMILSNWTNIGDGRKVYPIELPAGQYFFSCSGVDEAGTTGYLYLQKNPKGLTDWNVKSQYLVQGKYVPENSLITIDEKYNYRFWWYGEEALFNKIENIQLERGTSASEYAAPISDLSEVKLKKQGKNLIPYPYEFTEQTVNGVTATVREDGGILLNGTATDYTGFILHNKIPLLKKGVYYSIGGGDDDVIVNVRAYEENDTDHIYWMDSPKQSDAAYAAAYPEYSDYVYIGLYIHPEKTFYNKLVYPRLCVSESGAVGELEFEEYTEPVEYTAAEDGSVSGVKSIYPSVTLTTDTENVIIEAEYNRDINKAFAEIEQAIISLGGEV